MDSKCRLLYAKKPRNYREPTPVKDKFDKLADRWNEFLWFIQILHVYEPKYETGGQYWPEIHSRVVSCLVLMQVLFIGMFSLKGLSKASVACIPLPFLTWLFHEHCCQRFLPTFKRFNLEVCLLTFRPFFAWIPKIGFLKGFSSFSLHGFLILNDVIEFMKPTMCLLEYVTKNKETWLRCYHLCELSCCFIFELV